MIESFGFEGSKGIQKIMEASLDGFLVADSEGVCLEINSAYTRDTGIAREDIVGHNMKELINSVWMRTSIVLEVLLSKCPVSMEHDTKNGKHILVSGNPILNSETGEIELVVVNTRDLSYINSIRLELDESKALNEKYIKTVGAPQEDTFLFDGYNAVVTNQYMRNIYEIAKRVSSYNTTVLITGESGTGKELVAKYIHFADSRRCDKPFVVINCGAIPSNLLESELFGYEDGAFTGAVKGGKKGLLEQADGGVLFLDEIGEMDLSLQVKILRVLEEKKVMRIGSCEEKEVDVRIVAATNKNLGEEVKAGNFREDLYYRLNVISLEMLPLRERKDEILPLSTQFIAHYNQIYNQNKKLTYDLISEMELYKWPGNVRELKNVIENMVVLSNGEYLHSDDLPWIRGKLLNHDHEEEIASLQEMLDRYEKILLVRSKEKWKTTEKMGEMLKVNQSTISRKLKKYGL